MQAKLIELSSRVWGYETLEDIRIFGKPDSYSWPVRRAYNPFGEFIGTVTLARQLHRLGIEPELNHPHDAVCSIGYSSKKRAWYGWGLGKIKSFRPGSKVSKKDELFGILPDGYVVRTWERARWCARLYAEAVNEGETKGEQQCPMRNRIRYTRVSGASRKSLS